MVLKILFVVLALIAAILIYAGAKPSTFHVETYDHNQGESRESISAYQ